MKMMQEGCMHQNRYTTLQSKKKKSKTIIMMSEVMTHLPLVVYIPNMVINMQTRIFSKLLCI